MTHTRAFARLLPLAVAIATVNSGCQQISAVTTAIDKVAPGLTSSLISAAAGQLIAPPKNANQNLVPIFVKALAGSAGPSQDDVSKILALCNGVFVNKLPATPGITSVSATTATRYSAFGLLGTGDKTFTIKGEDQQVTMGLGGAGAKKSQDFSLIDALLFNNAPIFSALFGSDGKYKTLDLADTVDLRSQMPPIRSQGQRGTCVLFAATGILDYMYAKQNLPIKHASPQFMDWLYQMEVKTKVPSEQQYAWQDTGTVPEAFYPLLHIDGNREVTDDAPYIPPQQGYLSEEQCPYNAQLTDQPADSDLVEVSKLHLGSTLESKIAGGAGFASQGAYFFLVKSDAQSFEAALAGGQPIQLGYPVYAHDWDAPSAANNYAIPEMTEEKAADSANIGFHSVDIVGYERSSSAPGGGYFIVRNSWGEDWGEAGYCRVSYDTTFKYAHAAHVATPYNVTFKAAYDVAPPPKDAPPADQVLASRPLPTGTDLNTYTDTDVQNGADFDQVFAAFLGELQKAFGIKLPF